MKRVDGALLSVFTGIIRGRFVYSDVDTFILIVIAFHRIRDRHAITPTTGDFGRIYRLAHVCQLRPVDCRKEYIALRVCWRVDACEVQSMKVRRTHAPVIECTAADVPHGFDLNRKRVEYGWEFGKNGCKLPSTHPLHHVGTGQECNDFIKRSTHEHIAQRIAVGVRGRRHRAAEYYVHTLTHRSISRRDAVPVEAPCNGEYTGVRWAGGSLKKPDMLLSK